jgi:plasmid stability protein
MPAAACAQRSRAPPFIAPSGYAQHRPERPLRQSVLSMPYALRGPSRRSRLNSLPDQQHVNSIPACAQHEEAAMAVMIQIRNVPEPVHRVLKARSALLGKSLSDLILEELQALAALPAPEELLKQLREGEPFKMKRSSAALIRKERDAA